MQTLIVVAVVGERHMFGQTVKKSSLIISPYFYLQVQNNYNVIDFDNFAI